MNRFVDINLTESWNHLAVIERRSEVQPKGTSQNQQIKTMVHSSKHSETSKKSYALVWKIPLLKRRWGMVKSRQNEQKSAWKTIIKSVNEHKPFTSQNWRYLSFVPQNIMKTRRTHLVLFLVTCFWDRIVFCRGQKNPVFDGFFDIMQVICLWLDLFFETTYIIFYMCCFLAPIGRDRK